MKKASRAFNSFLDKLEDADRLLRKARIKRNAALPSPEVLMRVVRQFAESMNPMPVREHVALLKVLLRTLDDKAAPALTSDGQKRKRFNDELLHNALEAIEDLATRSAYFVGMAKGVSLAMPGGLLHLPTEQSKAKASRSRGRGPR